MIDYKTIISTTDSKVTLMQWLQALTEEFGEAKIKSVVFDASTSRLSLSIMKEDGTAFTTTQALYSLTADEQSLINNLIKSVTASSDGVTFSKAVSFQGNESHNGSEIHNGYNSFLGDENHAGSEMHKGTATFTDLRSDDLTATDGQELVSWDGTTTALKGKADRPTYNGGDLALKSDVSAVNQSVAEYLYAYKAFIARGSSGKTYPFPSFLNGGTDYKGMYAGSYVFNAHISGLPAVPTSVRNQYDVTFANGVTLGNGTDYIDCTSMFFGTPVQTSINLRSDMFNGAVIAFVMFANSNITKISVEGDGIKTRIAEMMFSMCNNLTEIGNFDFSAMTWNAFYQAFYGLKALTALHCTHYKYSFDLSHSVALTESAVQEIFGNLDVVSSTQTVTLPAVVYDLLTTDDLAIANGKGWAVARAS